MIQILWYFICICDLNWLLECAGDFVFLLSGGGGGGGGGDDDDDAGGGPDGGGCVPRIEMHMAPLGFLGLGL